MINKNMKKTLVIGLSVATLLPTITFAKTYSDVNSNNYGWAQSAIDILSDKGVISGYEDGKFKPDRAVSFEEVFQLLVQVLNPSDSEIKAAKDKYEATVKNAGVSDWAIKPITVALYRNILSETALKDAANKGFLGAGNNKKYPIRANIAVFFAKGLNLSSNGDQSLLKHKDLSKIDSTTRGYLASLVNANIFSSTGSDGHFEGDRHIKRAEMALITKASYDYIGKNPVKEEEMEGNVILASKLNDVNVLIIEKNNQKYSFSIDSATKYSMKDKNFASFSDLAPGQKVKIKYTKAANSDKEGLAKSIEITNSEQNLVGYINSKDSNNTLTIRYRNNTNDVDLKTTKKISTSDTKSFKFDDKAKINRFDKQITYNEINNEDLVEFKTDSNGNIKEMNVFPKDFTVTGRVISSSSYTNSGTIILRMSDNKDYTFYVTNDSKDLRNISTNDNISLRVNYKVAIETTVASNIVIGNIDFYENFYNRADGYIRVRQDNGQFIEVGIDNSTRFYDRNSVIQNAQVSTRDFIGRYAAIDTVKNNYNGKIYAREIRLINRDDIYTLRVQVIEKYNPSSVFNQSVTWNYDLKVLDSTSPKIQNGKIINLKNSTNDLKRYDVYELRGLFQRNGNSDELNNFEMIFKENPGRALDGYNGYSFGHSNGTLTLK